MVPQNACQIELHACIMTPEIKAHASKPGNLFDLWNPNGGRREATRGNSTLISMMLTSYIFSVTIFLTVGLMSLYIVVCVYVNLLGHGPMHVWVWVCAHVHHDLHVEMR